MMRTNKLVRNRIVMYLLVGSRTAVDYLVLSTLEVSAGVVLQAALLYIESEKLVLSP